MKYEAMQGTQRRGGGGGEVEVEERRGGQGEFCSVLGGRSWVGRWGTRDNSA